MLEQAQALQDQMVAWRRDFHMHPELSFQEVRTAQKVSEALTEMGIEAQTGVGITGVVGRIGDDEGPVVAIRADMDALPIVEANDVPYRSQTDGVMHACGHDAHTAILLGVARILNDMPDRPAGQVRLLFQPSEEKQDDEGQSGATRMIDDGAIEGIDAAIALHIASTLPSGKIMIKSGYAGAASDRFEARIMGRGGHAAYPHETVDPIFVLAQVLNAIHGVRARRVDPTKGAVITVGMVHAGDAANVIPNEVAIQGTIRSFEPEIREQLWADLEQAMGVARAFGGDYELIIHKGYPALHNDHAVAELIEQVAVDVGGEDVLLPPVAGMGGEDFAYMIEAAPGAMFMLGAKLDELSRPHHNPVFDVDEGSFALGAAVLAETAVRLLKQHA
ncbi:MAG: amidohydrolase [Chloroflexi bacterium]|nr:amidohydrolase [Chloroflexota bacterium]